MTVKSTNKCRIFPFYMFSYLFLYDSERNVIGNHWRGVVQLHEQLEWKTIPVNFRFGGKSRNMMMSVPHSTNFHTACGCKVWDEIVLVSIKRHLSIHSFVHSSFLKPALSESTVKKERVREREREREEVITRVRGDRGWLEARQGEGGTFSTVSSRLTKISSRWIVSRLRKSIWTWAYKLHTTAVLEVIPMDTVIAAWDALCSHSTDEHMKTVQQKEVRNWFNVLIWKEIMLEMIWFQQNMHCAHEFVFARRNRLLQNIISLYLNIHSYALFDTPAELLVNTNISSASHIRAIWAI